jgi:hypothetical protein
MLPAIGEDHERRLHVLGVCPRLLLRIVGVEILPLRFEDAQGAVQSHEDIIRPAAARVEFEADLMSVQQLPAALAEGFINENSGKRFWGSHDLRL